MSGRRSIVLSMVIVAFSLLGLSGSALAIDTKIAVFPFKINSEKNLTFLQKGISDILCSRLSTVNAEMFLIGPTNLANHDDALRVAREKNTDYFITGSVTVFGNSVNTTAFLYNSGTGKEILVFNKSDESRDDLFITIKAFADEILQKFDTASDKTVVKDVAVKKDIQSDIVLKQSVFKSQAIKSDINSISAGDVNGDGVDEVVFTDKHTLFIASSGNDGFRILKTIPSKHYLTNIAVDVLDSNKNGISEIFVTAVRSKTNYLNSYVLEWNGSDFEKTVTKAEWFFSVKPVIDNDQKQLVGQEQHFADEIFGNNVHRLFENTSGKGFSGSSKVGLPSGINIYDFTYGDAMNKGARNLVSYTPGGYIAVYDENNNETWKSSSRFGGSLKYLEYRKHEMQKRTYLPHRLIVDDIDNDNITEIVTVSNHNSTPRALINLKNFKEGNITCLSWNNLNFEPEWKTPSVAGYISDFAISDLNGNGKKELIYAVVVKVGKMWKKKQTYFVIQTIQMDS